MKLGKLFGGGAAAVVKAIGEAGDRLFTSDEERGQLEAVMRKLASAEALKQIEVNLAEAKHSSIFVAGWRPMVGWTCAAGLAMHFIFFPIAESLGATPPKLDWGQLNQLILAMLGFGGLRSWEKRKEIARQ